NSIFKRVNNTPAANPLFLLRRARGSLGSESPILNGDNIGQVAFEGCVTGGGYSRAAAIFVMADGAPGSTIPGYMAFSTRNGSGVMNRNMIIDSYGRVGIGTTSPGGNLEIYKSSGQLDVMLNRASNSSAALLHFQTAGTSEWALYTPSGGNDFYIDRLSGLGNLVLGMGGEYVGIRTNNPTAPLDVHGVTRINPTSTPNRYVQIGSTAGSTNMFFINNAGLPTVLINSGGLSYFSGGNLGIGTTNPSEDLHVVGSIKMVDGNEAVDRIMRSDPSGTGSWANPASIPGIWGMNGTKIYYTGGNVGIGNSNPGWGHKLSVTATTGIGAYVKTTDNIYPALYVTNSGTGKAAHFYNGDVIVENGNLGIGTWTPGCKLRIWENSIAAYQIMLEQDSHNGDAAIRFQADTVPATSDFTAGIDNDDDNNFEISNTSSLTGSGQTDYTDTNTMMRINHARNAGVDGIVDFNHQSRARVFLADSIQLWADPLPAPPWFQPWLLDWYMRPWFPIPFNKKSPQNRPGFDEHSEFTLSAAPPPAGTPLPWAFFTANEEGYYQVNARVEIIPDSLPEGYLYDGWALTGPDDSHGMTKPYPPGYSGTESENLRQASPPPFPVLLSIGIFVNGSLYAQGNNYQLNTLLGFPGDWLFNQYQEFMNAPNVSDVVYLDADDYVEIYVLVTAVDKTTPPSVFYWFPFWVNIVGDDNGVFTFVSVHKVS
ncbi:MAG: hypothetical protein KAG99_07155, partial [Bacteroidales bacterium]|nr:hypothetical protein [Bacteroidales bacterium]